MLRLLGACPRIVNVDAGVIVGEFSHDIDDAGVAQIRAIFLEGQTHDQDARAFNMNAPLDQCLDQLRRHMGAHAVIEAPPGENDFRVISDRLGLVGLIVGCAWLFFRSPLIDPLLIGAGIGIVVLAAWPMLEWIRRIRPWFPVFEILMLTTINFTELPFLFRISDRCRSLEQMFEGDDHPAENSR